MVHPKTVTRKIAVILAADAEGYTRLMREAEEPTLETLTEYRKIMDDLIARHEGRVFGASGDSVVAEFGSAVEAVRCAITIQEELVVRNAELPDERRLRFRIGIHLGDVMAKDDDLFGDGVNVAARMEGLAEPGGVCVSHSVFDQVKHKLSLGFEDMGPQHVKNVVEPVPAYRLMSNAVSVSSGATTAAKPSAARRWRVPVIAAAAVAVVAIAGAGIWNYYARAPEPATEVVSEERMTASLTEMPSIAVLPFANISGDPEQEYFADGIAEDIITDLSQISGLFVIARNSSFKYRGKSLDLIEVARELKVRFILEGSVRRAGDQVRINAQLIDATTGGHLWAKRYDGTLKDVFALQDKVTRQIVAALAVKLTASEQEQAALKETNSADAYDAFLKGWEHYRRRTPPDFAKAVGYFKQAVELDPQYGRAYAALAIVYWKSWLWTVKTDPTMSLPWTRTLKIAIVYAPDRADEYLRKAMQNPTALAHRVASEMRLQNRRFDAAIAEAESAIVKSPSDPEGYVAMGEALIFGGQPEKAVQFVERAMQLDPHAAVNLYLLGLAAFSKGRLDNAVTLFERALKRSPFNRSWNTPLAAAYAHIGRDREAQVALGNFGGGLLSVWNMLDTWPFKDVQVADRFGTGLVKAGMCCQRNVDEFVDSIRKEEKVQ